MSPPVRANRFLLSFACLGLAGAVAGCELGPDFLAPLAPTETGYRKDNSRVLPAGKKDASQNLRNGETLREDWWALFRSPDIDATVRAAIAGNLTLVQAAANLRQAEQNAVAAGGQLYPTVNIVGAAERQRLDFKTLGIQTGPTFPGGPSLPAFREFNVFSVGPTVSYSLDIWGGTRRFIEEREAQAEYQGYQLAAAYLSLTGNAVSQAITIAAIRAQIDAANDIIANDEKN